MPKFSVIIPLYNKGPYIARALNSVLKQTIQDFEIVVVDDGSTDEGVRVVREYKDQRIRLIQQENHGVSAARNRGIREARAELIAFLDADDEWLPGFLTTILRLKENYPEAGLFVTAYCKQGTNTKHFMKNKAISPKPWEGIIPRFFNTALYGDFIISSSVCIPKKIFNHIGMFREDVWWSEDWEMWSRIALYYTVAFSWDYGSIYHYDVENRANEKRELVRENPFIKTGLFYLKENKEKKDPVFLYDLKKYIEYTKMRTAARALKSGEPEFARKILRTCETKEFLGYKLYICMLSYIPANIFFKIRLIIHNFLR